MRGIRDRYGQLNLSRSRNEVFVETRDGGNPPVPRRGFSRDELIPEGLQLLDRRRQNLPLLHRPLDA